MDFALRAKIERMAEAIEALERRVAELEARPIPRPRGRPRKIDQTQEQEQRPCA